MPQPDHYVTKLGNTTKKPDLGDQVIKAIFNKLPAGKKDEIARMFGIDTNPTISNPDYKGNPKDINPKWKPKKK